MNKAGGDKANEGVTRSLQRGLHILEVLASSDGDAGLGITEIAKAVGLHKATATRLVQTLCALGYAYQDDTTRRYKLTGKVLSIGAEYQSGLNLPQRAGPHLARLRELTDETVHLGVRELDRIVYIVKLTSQRPVQIASAVGQTMPLHTTALGKAILSGMSEEEREHLMARLDLQPRTERSITTIEELRREVAETSRRGYSIDHRENEDTIVCVGAAIINSVGEAVGAISVSGPSFRMAEMIPTLGEMCRKTAADIGAEL